MSVRKACGKTCPYADHRCEHSWESRLMVKGVRRSVYIDDFVLARGNRPHVKTKTEAEKIETEEIAKEWRDGGDPRVPPPAPAPNAHALVVAMRDYMTWELKKLAKAARGSATSEMRHLVLYYGATRPLVELEHVALVQQFKDDFTKGWRPAHRRRRQETADVLADGTGREQGWGKPRGLVAVDRVLQRQRHFMHWCQHQTPPLLTKDPFHEFGVTIDVEDEEPRGRRLHDGEEQALLQACQEFNNWRHKFAGAAIERRIRGALGLGARGSELDRVQNKHIDYKEWIVKLTKGKSKKERPIWVEQETLREILKKRRFLGPEGHPFGDDDGKVYEDRTAWEAVAIRAHEIRTKQVVATVMETGLHFRDFRRECASRWWDAMSPKDINKLSLWLGHSSWKMTQRYLGLSDAELGDNGMKRALGGGVGGA
jgi:integrase